MTETRPGNGLEARDGHVTVARGILGAMAALYGVLAIIMFVLSALALVSGGAIEDSSVMDELLSMTMSSSVGPRAA